MRKFTERLRAAVSKLLPPERPAPRSAYLTVGQLHDMLSHVESRSADYSAMWADCAASADFIQRFAELRRFVDPDKPFFFGVLANGIKFAGDARDLPCALHALSPASNVVYSFEPSPSTFRLAAATVALNTLRNVRLVNAAVGAETERITFFATPGNSAISSTRMHGQTFYNEWEQIPVSQVSLDGFLREQGSTNVRAIKIDVEGGELAVINGAANVIGNCRPALSFEYTPAVQTSHGWEADDVISVLKPLGLNKFEAMVEPSFRSLDIKMLPFPLPDGIQDQVNVFATSA